MTEMLGNAIDEVERERAIEKIAMATGQSRDYVALAFDDLANRWKMTPGEIAASLQFLSTFGKEAHNG